MFSNINCFRDYKLVFIPALKFELLKQITEMFSVSVDADVTVIGSGPGGYVAAIKAAQLGFKVR